ncbi:flagellar motor switch protein FliN [bacterium]|jgi:flagellar motor switch protein FliN|nr:flagellar motor switch protein FliN [bacterium]
MAREFQDPLSDLDPVMEQAFSVNDLDGGTDDVSFPDPGTTGVDPTISPTYPAPAESIQAENVMMDDGIPNIAQIEFPDLGSDQVGGKRFEDDIFSNIPVKVSVELGRSKLSLKEVYELTEGSIIELERLVGEPLDLVINGQVIAQGEVVAIDNKYGLRIKTLVSKPSR